MPPVRDKIFVSYSHKDKKWLDDFLVMIQPKIRENSLSVWSDRDILTGQKWRQEIENAIASARVAVLAVSNHFMASPFINEVELPKFLAASKSDELRVCWCLLSECLYEDTQIAEFHAAHDIRNRFDKLRKARQTEEMKKVVSEVNRLYQDSEQSSTASWMDSIATESETTTITETCKLRIGLDTPFRDFSQAKRDALLQAIERILDEPGFEINIADLSDDE